MKNIILLFIILSLVSCKQEDAGTITYGNVCTNSPIPVSENIENFSVNIENLQKQLFSQNTSILLGLNKVHQAKDEVNIARARLYPSLNLSTLLFAAANPTFAVSAVEVMLPFLAPSNWSRLRESKHLAIAQGEALKTIQLNSYASAVSTYLSINSDVELINIYNQELQDLQQLKKLVEQLYNSGLASRSDLDRAEGAYEVTKVGLSKINGLVSKEIAEFRRTLNLPLKTAIEFSAFSVDLTNSENTDIDSVAVRAQNISPELSQIRALKKAAEENKWSHQFAFIGGGSLRSPSMGPDQSVSFDNISGGMQFNIGYANVPLMELSQDRITEIELREKEVILEINERTEYSTAFVNEAKVRYDAAFKAKKYFSSIYARDMTRYKFGQVDLFSLLDSRSKLRETQIEVLRSQTQLALNRVVLQRLTLEGTFSNLNTCILK